MAARDGYRSLAGDNDTTSTLVDNKNKRRPDDSGRLYNFSLGLSLGCIRYIAPNNVAINTANPNQ